MQPEEIRRTVIDPDGRTIHLTEEAWAHILEHQELAGYERLVAETLTHPLDRCPDVRPERERYFTEGKGPSGYFCVVVEFIGEVGDVITAFGHRNPR